MPHWIPLAQLLERSQNDSVPVRRRFAKLVRGLVTQLEKIPGESCILFCDNPLHFAAGLFAIWHAGKTALLPPNGRPETLLEIAGETKLCVSDVELGGGLNLIRPKQDEAAEFSDKVFPALERETTRLVIFTSGSTGEAKRICKTLAQLDDEITVHEELWGREMQGARIAATVSHQHIYGLLFRILWPLAAGREIDERNFLYPDQLQILSRAGPYALISSPAYLARIIGEEKHFGNNCTFIFSSGGVLNDELSRNFLRHLGHAPVEIFGSSETGGIANRQRRIAEDNPPWRALPGVQLSVDDADLLHVCSPFTADEILATGDRVRLVSEQAFEWLGRADRIVKLAEKRLSLDQLENELLKHPSIQEARALLLPAAENNRPRLAVVAVLSNDGARLEHALGSKLDFIQTLKNHLAQRFETVLLPRVWKFIPEMPKNTQAKTSDKVLRDLFEVVTRPIILENVSIDDGVRIHIEIPHDLYFFRGHFTTFPIVPGFILVDWAATFAKEQLGCDAPIEKIEALKFRDMVLPGQRFHLEIHRGKQSGSFSFRYFKEARNVASGRLHTSTNDV